MLDRELDVNVHNTGSCTALTMAIYSSSLLIIKLPLCKEADIEDARFGERETLHWLS